MNEKNSYLPQKTDVFVSLRIGFIKILLDKPKSLIRHNVERFVLVNFTKTNGSICAKMRQEMGT